MILSLRSQNSRLEQKIDKFKKLVGSDTMASLKCDKRMSVAIDSLATVFQEKGDKQCEYNAKASFLLHQVRIILIFITTSSNNIFFFMFVVTQLQVGAKASEIRPIDYKVFHRNTRTKPYYLRVSSSAKAANSTLP